MIDFRYHLVSIVAIFLALATGVALGAGPLQAPLTEGLVDQAEQDRRDEEELRADVARVEDQIAFGDAYAVGTAAAVAGDRLAGRTVCIVTLPGADSADVRAVREQVVAAGATVASTVTMSADLLDPVNRPLAEGLAEQVLDEDDPAPDGAESYQLLGAAFARAFLTPSRQEPAQDDDANSIESALAEADFVRVDGAVDTRAQLALVVAGDPPTDAVEGQAAVTAELVGALDAGSLGAVLAGTPASAEAGAVRAVRESDAGDEVSTVDAVGLPAGRVVTVLALAEQATGGVGQYGQDDAEDGAVPDPAPAGSAP